MAQLIKIADLKVGDKYRLITEPGEHYVSAKVEVVSVGFGACAVKIVQILDQAPNDRTMDGQEMVVTFDLLYPEPY